MTEDQHEEETDFIVAAGRGLFAGAHPVAQGAALAELTAIWVAGHPFEMWEDIMKLQIDTILELAANIQKQRG